MSRSEEQAAELRAAWEALPEGERDAIVARVKAEHPSQVRFAKVIEAHCMAELAARIGTELLPSDPEPESPILDSQGRPYSQGKPLPEKPRPRLMTEFLEDIEEQEEECLWPGRIPTCSITPILARMGTGKSTFLSWLASTVSLGRPWPDCPDDNPAGSVLILQAEESASRAIKPRMSAFGFARGKVEIIKGVDRGDGRDSWFSLAADVETLADKCRQRGDVRLIIVDPITSYIRGVNGFNDVEMRQYYQPLFALAEDFDLAVVPSVHPNKDHEKDILDRMSGSGALLQMARMAWYLSEDPHDKTRRLLSLLKGNMLGATRTALAVHFDGRKKSIIWFSKAVSLDARQVDHLLQKQAREEKLSARPGPDPTETKKAEEFIIDLLAKGTAMLSAAQDTALNVGIKPSTFRRALKNLMQTDGRVHRDRGPEDGRWWLRLDVPIVDSPPEPEGEKPSGEAPAGDS